MMIEGDDLSNKKLRGSGGYVFAKITDEEQKKGNLGGPDLFLAGVGRLKEDRFSKYYCNRCEKEFQGSPTINYEKPNEDLGEGVTLIEKGEYKCTACNNTIAQYRKFNSPEEPTNTSASIKQLQVQQQATGSNDKKDTAVHGQETVAEIDITAEAAATTTTTATAPTHEGFISIYKNSDTVVTEEVLWKNISKIGDIVLLGERMRTTATSNPSQCASCGYRNEEGAVFCEECGKKLG